jgi:hypothetical protein
MVDYFMSTIIPTLLICVQSGTALGATWDVALIEVGLKILAQEAKLHAVSSMNGPTCNIQRVRLLCVAWL